MSKTTTYESAPLSEREVEILQLVATGATNQQIAAQLGISVSTVKVHLRNVFAKINVSSRTEASFYAVRAGLVVIETSATADIDKEKPTIPAPETAELYAPTAKDEVNPPLILADTSLLNAPPQRALQHSRQRSLILVSVLIMLILLTGTIWLLRQPISSTPASTTIATEPTPVPWEQRTTMDIPRTHFAIASYDGRFYVIGGETRSGISDVVERYDPQSNTWARLTSKPTAVADAQAITIGGKIYVAGGRRESGEISNQLESYDPDSDQWEALAPLPQPLSQYAAATVDGKFYLFGGWDGTAYRSDVWKFQPDLNTWESGTPAPEARGQISASVLGSRIHLIGGRNMDGDLALHRSYDPIQDRPDRNPWQVLAPLPQPIASPVSIVVLDSIYTFRAETNEGVIYNSSNDSWSPFETTLPTDTVDLQGILLNTHIHLIGSSPSEEVTRSTHFQYKAIYYAPLPLIQSNN